jgi:ribonucleoside-diphosphate reductase beta chain
MSSVNALEAIRFYVSFACTFAFAERELMEGNSKIIRLIARDENLHLTSTQHVLNLWAKGKDDPEMAEIAEECKEQATQIFLNAVEQEKEWAAFLFQHGSMIGLNKEILCQYVEFIANHRMSAIGLGQPFDIKNNPLPWMNNYLSSDNVQVAPQESEISSYLVGQIDSEVNAEDFDNFDL